MRAPALAYVQVFPTGFYFFLITDNQR
jgi:hypothetical protein